MVLKSEVSISVHYRTYDILDCKTARTLHPRTRTSYTFLPSLSTSLIISNLHTRQSWWERHRTQQANVLIFSSNWNEFLKIARPHFFFLNKEDCTFLYGKVNQKKLAYQDQCVRVGHWRKIRETQNEDMILQECEKMHGV